MRAFNCLQSWIKINCRSTPFANGAGDDASAILKRIGEGSLNFKSDNWLSVSSQAKVSPLFLLLCSGQWSKNISELIKAIAQEGLFSL